MVGRIFIGITYVYIFLLWILSGLMHLWTIYIAYEDSGWFWGIVTLFFPVIAQIIWGYKAYAISGFESPYIQWLIIVVILWTINWFVSFIISLFDRN